MPYKEKYYIFDKKVRFCCYDGFCMVQNQGWAFLLRNYGRGELKSDLYGVNSRIFYRSTLFQFHSTAWQSNLGNFHTVFPRNNSETTLNSR